MEDEKERYLLFWTGKEAGMFLLCKSLCLLKVVEKLGNLTSPQGCLEADHKWAMWIV